MGHHKMAGGSGLGTRLQGSLAPSLLWPPFLIGALKMVAGSRPGETTPSMDSIILGHTLNAREPRLEAGRIMIYY